MFGEDRRGKMEGIFSVGFCNWGSFIRFRVYARLLWSNIVPFFSFFISWKKAALPSLLCILISFYFFLLYIYRFFFFFFEKV